MHIHMNGYLNTKSVQGSNRYTNHICEYLSFCMELRILRSDNLEHMGHVRCRATLVINKKYPIIEASTIYPGMNGGGVTIDYAKGYALVNLGLYMISYIGNHNPTEVIENLYTVTLEVLEGMDNKWDKVIWGVRNSISPPSTVFNALVNTYGKILKYLQPANINDYNNGYMIRDVYNTSSQYGNLVLEIPIRISEVLGKNSAVAIRIEGCFGTPITTDINYRLTDMQVYPKSSFEEDSNFRLSSFISEPKIACKSSSPLDSDRMFTLEFVLGTLGSITHSDYTVRLSLYGGPSAGFGDVGIYYTSYSLVLSKNISYLEARA